MGSSTRPRITRVRARNFRSIEALDLELGDVTVLVGRNGSGKSNTVDVLRFLRDCATKGIEQSLISRRGVGVLQRDPGEAVEVGLDMVSGDWGCTYDMAFWADNVSRRRETITLDLDGPGDTLSLSVDQSEVSEQPDMETVLSPFSLLAKLSGPVLHHSLRTQGVSSYSRLREAGDKHRRAADAISGVVFYDFNPSGLRSPQRVAKAAPLDERGENLVAVLRDILAGPDGNTLRQSLRSLVDGAENIEVQTLAGHLVAELLYETGGDGSPSSRRFDLGLESDGTIRLVATLAALYQMPRQTLVVLEEPERNIHPGALAILADVIREASTRSQILVTTHSPELIDCFKPEELRVVERVDGATRIGPVEAAQQQAVRDNLFTSGEIMRMQGLQRDAHA